MAMSGKTTAAFDILLGEPRPGKQNVMDLTTPSGFWLLGSVGVSIACMLAQGKCLIGMSKFDHLRAPSLVLLSILNMKFDQSFCVIGLVCSSFVAINAATHQRHPWHPLGNTLRPRVQLGNILASRKLG